MKTYLHSTLCFLTLLPCVLQQDRLKAAQLPEIRVGFIIDGPWEGNEETLRITQEEILALTQGEFDVRFPPEMSVEADWTVPGIEAAIDRLLKNPVLDVLVTWGLITSDIICRRESFPKPIIAPVVLNVELQGIPYSPDSDSSGIRNLSYVTWPIQLKDDLETFHKIVPFRKLTYLLNQSVYTANPRLLENVTEVVDKLDFELEVSFLPVGFSAEETLEALPKGTEAIYAAPLLHMPQAEFDRLVEGLIQRRLPSFSLFGRGRVEQGLLASLSLDTDLRRVARRIALNLQRILLGEDAVVKVADRYLQVQAIKWASWQWGRRSGDMQKRFIGVAHQLRCQFSPRTPVLRGLRGPSERTDISLTGFARATVRQGFLCRRIWTSRAWTA